jgi:threonine dehydrogenase-like Zn-dependent dehydrogenase
MRAWAVVESGAPLREIEIPTPEPIGTQVLVEVTHCGVCRSDLHNWEGYYDLGGGKRISAAKLAVILAGESPANRGGPVAVAVISSNGKGDRPVESLEVKAPGGRPEYRSDPYRGASNLAGRSE